MIYRAFIFVSLICFLSSCSEPFGTNGVNTAAQLQKEIDEIDAYLAQNGIQAIKDPSGIRMAITEMGTGLPAVIYDTISIDYEGRLFSNGSVFDDGTEKFILPNLIQGWQIAFTKLPRGSKATLYIPSYYGYGQRNIADIPANSTLIFDVNFKDAMHNSSFLTKWKEDTTAIENYLTEKGIEAIADTSGVRYVVTTEGSGATPTFFDQVRITYSFSLLSDDSKTLITLDREPTETFYSRVVDYIQGMKVGLLNMSETGKIRLYVPSGLAFGPNGAVDSYGQIIIPANAVVIIDMELKAVL